MPDTLTCQPSECPSELCALTQDQIDDLKVHTAETPALVRNDGACLTHLRRTWRTNMMEGQGPRRDATQHIHPHGNVRQRGG